MVASVVLMRPGLLKGHLDALLLADGFGWTRTGSAIIRPEVLYDRIEDGPLGFCTLRHDGPSQGLFRKLHHFPDVPSYATDILFELPVILANDHGHTILGSQSYMYKAVHS
jgi:hypothetical protein